jgi:hypothetical protein
MKTKPKKKTNITSSVPKADIKNPSKPTNTTPSFYNQIHKKLVILYGSNFTDMREVWKQVRRDYRKETKVILPKGLKKHPEVYAVFETWVETKISEAGKSDVYYINKSDLKLRGWNDKIIEQLYPRPNYSMYLGRGRYAYYYDGLATGELEDSEEFIEYIAKKIARSRKRSNHSAKNTTQFGTEFIL